MEPAGGIQGIHRKLLTGSRGAICQAVIGVVVYICHAAHVQVMEPAGAGEQANVRGVTQSATHV
jgi:hypothetical protein